VIKGYLCATTITTIHYLATKVLEKNHAQNQIKNLVKLFEIASVNSPVIENALALQFSDFEDAVLYQASCHAGVDAIVTRVLQGFKKSQLPVYSPDEMLKILEAIG